MNKELREMLEAIANKKEAAKAFIAENKLVEAQAAKDELIDLQNKFDIAKDLYDEEKTVIDNKVPDKTLEKDAAKNFINGLRTKFQNAMSEGSKTDGGYTVPQDIQTKINEYRESKDSLEALVTVEPVTTLSGSRVFKKRAQQTGFAKVLESGEIEEKATPQFTNLEYKVDKYAGFLRVTSELLADSDQAIEGTVTSWIGDESRVTRNQLILAVLGTKAKTAIADVDAVKDVLNVTLDPAFRYTSTIVTNQDGYNYLDKLKDSDGDYMLQPSIVAASGKQLFGVPVQVISNKDLPTADDKAPFIIGDLKESIVFFDRKKTEIRASDVASDAFLTDVTLFRAIERFEVKMRDDEAFVYGEIDLTPTP